MPKTRKETPQQARKSALESTLTPLYAVAGLTDAVAEEAKSRITARQQQAQQRAEERLAALKERRKQTADDVAKFVAELPENLRALPKTTRERAAKLSEQAADYREEAGSTYSNLAGRGKRAVDEALRNGQTLSATARARADEAAKDAAKGADPVFENVQEATTRLRKRVTGRTATETVAPKTTRKAPVTKATAKKTAAKKAPVTKAATKKTTAKKAPAKKASAKKTASAR